MKTPQPAPIVKSPADTSWEISVALGLFLVVVATFWSAGKNGFVNYDDPEYITNNPQVQAGLTWASVKWAFTSTRETANWHPVTWLSHMLDYEMFGGHPRGHHLTNVFIHGINVVLLFLFLHRLTGAKWRSAAVALLFGLHPLRVESVAWISERKDVLSAFFFFLCLHAYVSWRKKVSTDTAASGHKSRPRLYLGSYCAALLFFALGLMSKPMLVTLPFVLLLLDYWPLRRFETKKTGSLFLEKIPFFMLSLLMGMATIFFQKGGGAMRERVEFSMRLQTAMVAYGKYLQKIFWPVDLAIPYPYPDHWPIFLVIFSLAFWLGAGFFLIRLRRSHPYLLTGGIWYLVMLLPVIGLIQVGSQSMADRYSYLPGIGIILALVWGFEKFFERWENRSLIFGIAVALIAFALMGVTRRQIDFWNNSETLFTHSLAVTKNNKVALTCLGDAYRDQHLYDDASHCYQAAIEIDPFMEQPQLNLGVIRYAAGRKDEAIEQLEQALKFLPGSALIHGNLGIFLVGKGRLAEAQTQLEIALKEMPEYPEAHVVLGDIYRNNAQNAEATEHYREALRERPHFSPAENRLRSLGVF